MNVFADYHVETKWECELNEELKNDAQMSDFFDTCEIYEPLNPRDSFYGGRTNTRKLWHKVTGDEKIHYADVCSLYPWVSFI